DARAQGRGTMTLAVARLVDYAFDVWQLHRVEIRAAVDNARSRAIPERLGFVQEGVMRDGERFGERYLDLVVYSMLDGDCRAPRGRVYAAGPPQCSTRYSLRRSSAGPRSASGYSGRRTSSSATSS